MAKKPTKLSKILRKHLSDAADPGKQIMDPVTGAMSSYSNAELLVRAVVEKAHEGKEWANLLVFGYAEGKPGQQSGLEQGDRSTEERLEDVTKQHLNDLAKTFIGNPAISPPASQPAAGPANNQPTSAPPAGQAAAAPDPKPAGAARRLLDLPSNRPNRAKGAGSKPAVEAGTPPEGG